MPLELDDAALERRLFTPAFGLGEPVRPQPDWPLVHAELRRPGVTLLLVWQEYRGGQPEGYGYSRFCDLYAAWRGRLSLTRLKLGVRETGDSSYHPKKCWRISARRGPSFVSVSTGRMPLRVRIPLTRVLPPSKYNDPAFWAGMPKTKGYGRNGAIMGLRPMQMDCRLLLPLCR